MMKRSVALVSAALIALSAPAFAQGASKYAPGQEMQKKGSVKGSPGASGYAPGQEMQRHQGVTEGRSSATEQKHGGASKYAPGHEMQKY
jgi:hypothetical protein